MANPYFNAVYYLTQNPDVFAAGYTVDTAWDHYAQYGANEAYAIGGATRAPNPWFDAKYYLNNNPDLIASGVTPATALDHFFAFGGTAAEDRAPNATIAANPITEASLLAYAKANADLLTAFGIAADATELTVAQQNNLITQFYAFGYSEERPSAPTTVEQPDPNQGETFTLTTGVDTLKGTTGNDTFIADNTVNTVISPADSVDGAGGNDTLKVYSKAADAVNGLALPQLTAVENLYINNGTLTDAQTLNVSTIAGLESVELDSPVAIVDGKSFIVKTTATQNVSLKNVTGAGDATVTLDGAVKASVNGVKSTDAAKAFTLDVKSETAAFTLNAIGAASTVTLTNSAAVTKLATLNVTGDKALTLTEGLTTLKTVDASANTGGVTLGLGTTAVDLAFTGGAGNDKVVIAGAQLNAKDALDGGAGTDTIVLADTTAAYAGINAAKNFEILGLGTSATTVDVGQITNGINQFAVNVNGTAAFGATFANALSTSKFSINNDAGNGTITIGNKTGDSATTVAIDNQSAAAQTITELDVSGATSVAVSSTGKVGSSNVITTLTNADNSSIVVTGAADLTITNALAGGTTGSKVDAAAFTGKLTVIGSAKNDILIGGSNDDSLTGGVGADTLTGNAGKDAFVLTQAAQVITSAAQADVITDFTTKVDTISFGTAVLAADVTKGTAAVADFAAALAAANLVLTNNTGGATQVNVQQVGADSYAFYNDGTLADADHVVKLTGVALDGIVAADIIA